MAKIDLDAMNIDEHANLRDRAIEKLAEKVAARQAELEAELQRLSQFGSKLAKKAQGCTSDCPRQKAREERRGRTTVQTGCGADLGGRLTVADRHARWLEGKPRRARRSPAGRAIAAASTIGSSSNDRNGPSQRSGTPR